MKIGRLNNNWNKINTKEELIHMLKGYKGILTSSMIDYLNSLIELEFSVIRDYINDDDRLALSELYVYKRIAMYNIYKRALNLFSQSEIKFQIDSNENGLEGLTIYALLDNRHIELFNFDYRENPDKNPFGCNNRIPKDYKTMRIGDISLFQTFESKELREAELMRIMTKLDRLYDEKNPFYSRPNFVGGWIYVKFLDTIFCLFLLPYLNLFQFPFD